MTQLFIFWKHEYTFVELEIDTRSLESCKDSTQILEVIFLGFASDEKIISVCTHTRQAL